MKMVYDYKENLSKDENVHQMTRAELRKQRIAEKEAAEIKRDNEFMMSLQHGPDAMELNFLHDEVRDLVKAIQNYQEHCIYLDALTSGQLRGDSGNTYVDYDGHATASVTFINQQTAKNNNLAVIVAQRFDTARDMIHSMKRAADTALDYDKELAAALAVLEYDAFQLGTILKNHKTCLLDCRMIKKYAEKNGLQEIADDTAVIIRELEHKTSVAYSGYEARNELIEYMKDIVLYNKQKRIEAKYCCDLDNGIIPE